MAATGLLSLAGAALGLLWITAARAQTAPWPGGDAVELGRSGRPAGLPGDFEPSGAAWHPRLGLLLVPDDEGRLAALDPDGGPPRLWRIGGDLEAVAIADPATPLVYLGIERPETVVEFDLERGIVTGRRWDLSSHMQGRKKKCGLEALTVVDGLFYAGHQCRATIHVFALGDDGSVSKIDEIAPEHDEADLAGMHWDPLTETLYTVYDDLNRIVERDREGRKRRAYTLPGAKQEGVASIPHCPGETASLFVAEDRGRVLRYDDVPIECPSSLYTWAGRPILLGVLLLMVCLAFYFLARARSASS